MRGPRGPQRLPRMRFRSVWQGGWTPEKMGEMDEMGRRLEEAGPPEKMGEMDEMGATVKGDDKQTRRRRGPHYGPPQKRNTDATPTQRQGWPAQHAPPCRLNADATPPNAAQRRRNETQSGEPIATSLGGRRGGLGKELRREGFLPRSARGRAKNPRAQEHCLMVKSKGGLHGPQPEIRKSPWLQSPWKSSRRPHRTR